MRVYCLHIHRREWVFFAQAKRSNDIDLQSLPSNQTNRFWNWVQGAYQESMVQVQTSQRPLWKWIRRMLEHLKKYIHPSESFLKELLVADKIELVYPAEVSQRFIERKWRLFLRRRVLVHDKGVLLNIFILPVTAAATIIPGPNVFVGWNGLRLYNHIMARRGARRMLANQVVVAFSPNPELKRQPTREDRLTEPDARILESEHHLAGLVTYLQRLNVFDSD
jgi:hypothetical protein